MNAEWNVKTLDPYAGLEDKDVFKDGLAFIVTPAQKTYIRASSLIIQLAQAKVWKHKSYSKAVQDFAWRTVRANWNRRNCTPEQFYEDNLNTFDRARTIMLTNA